MGLCNCMDVSGQIPFTDNINYVNQCEWRQNTPPWVSVRFDANAYNYFTYCNLIKEGQRRFQVNNRSHPGRKCARWSNHVRMFARNDNFTQRSKKRPKSGRRRGENDEGFEKEGDGVGTGRGGAGDDEKVWPKEEASKKWSIGERTAKKRGGWRSAGVTRHCSRCRWNEGHARSTRNFPRPYHGTSTSARSSNHMSSTRRPPRHRSH